MQKLSSFVEVEVPFCWCRSTDSS